MRRPSEVNWCRGRGDRAVALRAQVIRVDLETNGSESITVDVGGRAERRDRFGEGDRRAAVKNAERLARAIVDGHGCDDASRRELDDFDAECVGETTGCKRAKVGEQRDWIGSSHVHESTLSGRCGD